MIMGIDQIRQTDLTRRQGPSVIQPKQQRTRTIAEQANIHQDRLFAEKYFKAGAWKNEKEGVDSTAPSTGQFIKFSNDNSDPIAFVDNEKTEMNQISGRTPNRMALGINVFNSLKVHPAVLERVKYGGSTANPASVTENVLAQLFEVEKVAVLRSIMNNPAVLSPCTVWRAMDVYRINILSPSHILAGVLHHNSEYMQGYLRVSTLREGCIW